MAKAELGLKRVCLGCGARFYDLNKNPATCPSCGKVFDPLASSRSSRSRQSEVVKTQSKKSKADKSKQNEGSSSTEIGIEDDDEKIQDVEGLNIDAEDDEVFVEDIEEEDELIGSIDDPKDKDE